MVNSTKTYKAIKYILFVGCYLFWVSSAILIAVGVYAKVAKEGDVVDSLTADPALLFICIGSLMFTVTFFGCFGALRDNVRLLQIVLERTDLLIKTGIEKYRDDLDLENIIDFVQKKFQCCGGHSYGDWSYNVYFNCSKTNPSIERCGVPFSCCIQQKKKSVLNTMCGYGTQQEVRAGQSIYTTGCLDKIAKWGEQNLLLLAGMAAGFLSLEICMVSLAAALIHQIKLKMTKGNGKTTS
ncbi:tetraspanin-33 isoform X2 [Paramormyrops kingsleyae]|uniref:tetraspanin-33 isoform X2 n=1 Tax=Paramormyrops kingsleyae TaxID=1676925 RepID=UPI003B975433